MIALNCRGPRGDAKTKFLLVPWFSGVWTKLDARTRFCLYGKYTATLRESWRDSQRGRRAAHGWVAWRNQRAETNCVVRKCVDVRKIIDRKMRDANTLPPCGRCLVAHHGNSTPCGTSREHTTNPKHAPKIKQAIRAKIIACIPNHLDRL